MFISLAMRLMGKLKGLSALYDEYTRDADRRGDLHAGTTIRRSASMVWLGRDNVAGAREALKHALWMPSSTAFHLQHWYDLEAHTDIALYEKSLATYRDELLPKFESLRKSMLGRIQTVRCGSRWLRARVALADAEAGRDVAANLTLAKSLAKSLADERLGYPLVWSHLIRAGVEMRSGRTEQGIAALRTAVEDADRNTMITCGAAARLRLAALIGGSEADMLTKTAGAALDGEDVRKHERFIDVIAPGCHQ